MDAGDNLKINLEAEDDASPDIQRVFQAMERLRAKYEEVSDLMRSAHGMEIPFEAFERVVNRATIGLAKQFDAIGLQAESRLVSLHQATARFEEQQAAAAEKSAARQAAAAERVLKAEALAAQSRANAHIEALNRRAQAEARSSEQTFFLVQEANAKILQADAQRAAEEARMAQRRQQAEARSAEETFFLVQEANEKILRSDERRAAEEARLAEQAARRAAAAGAGRGGGGIGGILSGAAGGAGNVFGAAPGAIGNIFGTVGGGVMRTMEAGIGAIGGAVRSVTGFFGGLAESVMHTSGRVAEFIALGLSIASAYEVINVIERMFHSLGGAVTEFQDKMVQVQSLRMGENIKAEFDDVRAAVLETSMVTGRSAAELGNALFFIEGHGIKGAEALKVLDQAAKLAASGLGETDQLIRIVTGQMVAYGASADQAAHFFDVFAKTEQSAALPIGELSGQFQRLTPVTAALRIPIEQVGAAIATISQTGLGASRVITDLAGVLNSFIHSSPQQQKALEGIGYPIAELRKDLTDPSKGLINVLKTLWERSAHDIDAAGAIFSDRGRALVGFLALVRNSAADIDKVMANFANTAGTVEKIFAVNQQRITLQWERMTAVVQAYGIVLSETILPGIAAAMAGISDAMMNGDLVGAWQAISRAAGDALGGILTTLDNLAQSAFGGAYNVAVEIANGLWAGATEAIQSVVNAIADMIASFLLGHSWPPKGPLSQGTAGVQRWQAQYAEAMNQGSAVMTGAAANVATAMNAELGKIGAGGQSKEGLQMAIANIDQQLLPWKLAADSIKDSYNAMLHPLEAQITAIQRIKDLEYDRQQLKFSERDLELRMLKLRAEGDPVRRAQLAGQMAALQERKEQHSIESRIATLNREAHNLKPGRGTTPQEIALRRREIADELQILNLQRQQHKLVNVELLGQYEAKKAQLDVDKEGAGIAHDRFELEQKKALQPLLEQRDLLKNKMQAELDIIAKQTDGLEDQKRVLEAQLKLITAREAGQKKAAGGGAGAFHVPEGDPLSLSKNITAATDRATGDMAESLKKRLHEGLTTFATTYGPRIGVSLAGFMVGGLVGGLPGALAGAAFGPKLADALTARGVTSANLTGFVTDFSKNLIATFQRVGAHLQAGDILGSVDELIASARSWISKFEQGFFSEWYVASTTDEGATTTNKRYTGIGRSIVESIKGEMIDGPLDFASLREAFNTMLSRIYTNLTTGTGNYGAGGEMVVGPSPLQQIITAGLEGGSFVLGVVGATADALSNVFTDLAKNETIMTGANKLGHAIGVLIMGGTPEGLTSDEGVNQFVAGLAKLDRAMLEAGKKLGQAIASGIWQGIVENFTPGSGSLYIKPGSFLDLIVNGPGALGRGPGALNEDGTTRAPPPVQPAGAAPDLARHLGLPTPTSGDTSPLLAAMPAPEVAAQLGSDAAGGILQGFRDAWASDTSFKEDNSRFWQENVVYAAQDALGTHSPSTVFHQMGDDVLEGFQDALSSDNTTGAVVRTWLRSEVIAQARAILITGEGNTGGLAGVGIDALEAFGDAFATPPPSLSVNMRALGQSIVEDIMEPITDPRTGIIAQMRRQIDAMPKAPRRPTDDTLPTPDAGQRYAATGADFIVGGSGGTDSERVNLWATPGERVQVGAGNTGRQVTNHFNITVNGGDPDEVQQAIAQGVRAGLAEQGDAVPGELLNAWRTAKAQGATRSIGVQSRGARG